MWVAISGPDGSGKNVIAEWFLREGFENRTQQLPKAKDDFHTEMLITASYLSTALECSNEMINKDIVTIRSYWESSLVHAALARKFEKINSQELQTINSHFNLFSQLTPPPTFFVRCKISLMAASSRASLNGKSFNQDLVKAQIEAYDKFFEKVAVPVIELDMDKDIIQVFKDLEFGVSSIKSSRLDTHTIWRKTALR